MQCPKCQQENPADSNFCVNCGRKLERECPICATSPPPDTAFCKSCGRALAEDASRPEIGTEKAPPGAPTGERRQATIVFSDLSGYTAMNEKLDPEEVEAIMSRVKDEAVRIVEDYGGIVNQFVGDEVLALFGIPATHEDDPRRAVRAALELHEWVRGISPEVEARIGAPLTLHTGINTGLVVTHFRDEREGRHGITGDSVNTAARIVDQADADEILISLDTRRRIAHFFVTEAREPVAFKGKARPMSVFRIVGKTTVQTRFEAAKKSGLSAFTGREEELAALLARMDRASAGQGQLVAVSGEAGIGKTRLLHEFQLSLDSGRIETVPGRFLSHENAAPNLPFVEALRHILKLRDKEAAAESLKKAIANIRAIDTGLEQNIPLYLHLLGIPAKDHQIPPTLSGAELRKALDQALVAIILSFSRRKPAVLILENWRWVDEASDAVLKKLLEHIASHPLMVVVVIRPDFEPAWELPPDHYEKITLRPLGPEEDQTLMKSVVGSRHLPEGLAELVYGRTGGIPFFTEEVCRDLLAKEILLVMGGEAAITCLLPDISLPDSIQAVIRSRLDRLDGAARHVLRISSVIGQEFSLPVLERAFEDHDQLHQGLRVLQGQGLIRRVMGGPEQSFVFDQVTTQMVAYDTLLLQQRKVLHELIGKAIEEVYANRPEDHFKALGHHFSKSANVAKALHYLNLAGDRFKKYFSLGEARQQYLTAIDLLNSADLTPELKLVWIDFSLKLAEAAYYAGGEKIRDTLNVAVQYARQLAGKETLAKTIYWLGRLNYTLGDLRKSLPQFEECIRLAEELGDRDLQAILYNFSGRACVFTAEHKKGIEVLEKGIAMLEQRGNLEEVTYSKGVLAILNGITGNFAASFLLAEQTTELARRIGNQEREVMSLSYLGYIRGLRGDWVQARELFSKPLKKSMEIGNPLTTGLLLNEKGYSVFFAEDRQKGLALMAEGIRKIEATGSGLSLSLLYGRMAECQALAGNGKEAAAYGEKVFQIIELGDRWGEIAALRGLAIASAGGAPADWEGMANYIGDGLRLADQRGARPDLAITYFRYAEILQRKGDPADARQHLAKATALFSELEMPWWLEQAEALLERLAAGKPFEGYAPHADRHPTP